MIYSSGHGVRVARRWVGSLAWYAAATYLAVTVALAIWAYVPVAFHWHSVVVMTGSMEPVVSPGDVLVIQNVHPADLKIGQVVVVRDPERPGRMLSHRVAGVRADGAVITRGDANGHDDVPTPPENVIGIARLLIPKIGRPELWLLKKKWVPLVLWLTCTTAALMIANPPRKRRRTKPRRWAPTLAVAIAAVVLSGNSGHALWSNTIGSPTAQFTAGQWTTTTTRCPTQGECDPGDQDGGQAGGHQHHGSAGGPQAQVVQPAPTTTESTPTTLTTDSTPTAIPTTLSKGAPPDTAPSPAPPDTEAVAQPRYPAVVTTLAPDVASVVTIVPAQPADQTVSASRPAS